MRWKGITFSFTLKLTENRKGITCRISKHSHIGYSVKASFFAFPPASLPPFRFLNKNAAFEIQRVGLDSGPFPKEQKRLALPRSFFFLFRDKSVCFYHSHVTEGKLGLGA